MSDMTIEQKVGAMLAFGWAGEEPTLVNDHARELLEEMQVGSIVLLGRNVSPDLRQTAETINELQSLSSEPLFIIADQEGGMVARFVEGVTVFPSNMALGATGDPTLAYKAASATARELGAMGVNFNFAPCADVNNNPDNPIIGTRSYGESADKVAEFTASAITGYQRSGMIACAKHFPGHGDTAVDSHLALPSVPYPRERLDAVELKPFRAAIEAGVGSIMTAHILFPALDSSLPSTLSPRVVTGLLREELGYEGVVVTDCMEMKAIADNFGTPEAAVMAIEAGVDLVLVSHTLSTQRETREAILRAVKDGRISERRIDESVSRIVALKKRFSLAARRQVDPSKIKLVLRCPKHIALQQEIAEKAVTLVRNEEKLIPLRLHDSERVVITGLHPTVEPLSEAVRHRHANTLALRVDSSQGQAAIREVLDCSSNCGAVIVATCPREPWRQPIDLELQNRLIKDLVSAGRKIIAVAVREPYDIRNFPEVKTYICTYGYRGGMLEAAAKLIFGEIEPQGKLPVTIPESATSKVEQPLSEIPEYF
ncbi:MAG: glycoside hydrolase family 3 N-terminal domain-containing protein [Armatimonadota bacterium]|nr:glycoside hydrolase family 3 N-terminal domain-containing protein [Armatimonadota bacterium]